jgi:RNA polymerase sigma-70 factor, ECF subfamily
MGLVSNTEIDQPGSGEEVAALLAAAAAGDEPAWREIVDRYGRRVFALAKSRCHQVHLAEEITQSVFATVAAKLGSGGYAEQGRFEPWLFRVAMNRIRDEMRRRKRQADNVDPETFHVMPGKTTEIDPELPAMLAKLRQAMAELSDSDREVIELRHHGGMSFREIAEMLDQPLGTLLARHHRALRKLKQLMGQEIEDL